MTNQIKWLALIALTLTAACGDATTVEPTAAPDGDTSTRHATLYGALPADGETVRGELHLIAVVEGDLAANVRFMVDGAPLAELSEAPYRLSMPACDLTVGNHAYVVEITDAHGNRDYVEQFFAVEGCD